MFSYEHTWVDKDKKKALDFHQERLATLGLRRNALAYWHKLEHRCLETNVSRDISKTHCKANKTMNGKPYRLVQSKQQMSVQNRFMYLNCLQITLY